MAYIIAVSLYAYYSYSTRKAEIIRLIDDRLYFGASSIKYLFADDFHDRCTSADSITFEEEMENRRRINGYVKTSPFKWVYTLIEHKGKFYFAAPTVSEEEAKQRKRWYFYPYEDIPPEFVRAYETGKKTFVSYSDQWGDFRSVAIPEVSKNGTKYLSCADLDISKVKKDIQRWTIEAFVAGILFLFFSIPFILLYRGYNKKLVGVNNDLVQYRDHLEEQVELRTKALLETKEELKIQAINDNLTKVFNRNYIFNRMQEEINRSRRSQSPLTILMTDVDNFKAVNDTYGHLVGDKALQKISAVFVENLRSHDLVGRFGGDEFIIVLPDTSLEQSIIVADKLREYIDELKVCEGGALCSLSIGIAQWKDEESFEELLKVADERLYRAKELSGNRAVY
jgi:diguanylate cyclase (GGDEF)-like protein